MERDETDRLQRRQERREIENHSRALIYKIPHLIWTSGDEGHWTWSSPQWQSFTGQTQEGSLGRGWLRAIHPDDRAITLQSWHRAQSDSPLDLEHRIYSARKGVHVWHVTRSVPSINPEGVTNWIGTSTDIHVAREVSLAKDALLREMDHRTKNNFQVITSLLNLQARGVKDGGTRLHFAEVRNRISAIALVHELISRLGAFGKVDLATYAHQLTSGLIATYGLQSNTHVEVTGSGITVDFHRAVPVGLLLNELVSRKLRRTSPERSDSVLRIVITQEGSDTSLAITADNEQPIQRCDYELVTSLSAQLLDALAKQLRATVELGTTASVRFPAHEDVE